MFGLSVAVFTKSSQSGKEPSVIGHKTCNYAEANSTPISVNFKAVLLILIKI